LQYGGREDESPGREWPFRSPELLIHRQEEDRAYRWELRRATSLLTLPPMRSLPPRMPFPVPRWLCSNRRSPMWKGARGRHHPVGRYLGREPQALCLANDTGPGRTESGMLGRYRFRPV